MTTEIISYLAAGSFLLLFSLKKHRSLANLAPGQLPEFGAEAFTHFTGFLERAYQRTLYLGIAFIMLAATVIGGWPVDVKAFFMLLALVLFVINIPPRHAAMKLLLAAGLDRDRLKERGFHL